MVFKIFLVRPYSFAVFFSIHCLQAYNGNPCFEAEGLRKVCLHTHIVALAVKALKCGGAAAGATSLDGDHRDGAVFASALREFESDRPSFGTKVSQLMKISAVYSFPPDPLPHLPRAGASLPERFTCFEKTCTRCGTRYEEKADQSAEAVTQVHTVGIHAVWYGNILYLVVLCV